MGYAGDQELEKLITSMNVDFDIIIIGAGPSGCSAAYDLSHAGYKVLLADKTEFPRSKPCAGGLTIKTLQAIRYSVKPVIKNVCYHLAVSNGNKKSPLLKSKYPVCAMTIREEFDAYCLKQTLNKKPVFSVLKNIQSIKEMPEYIELGTSEGSLKATYLIGADGANSIVRKLTNQFENIKKGLAIEAQIFIPKQQRQNMEFDFSAVKFGYGWLFPKGDHVNAGLYTNDASVKLTKKELHDFVFSKLGDVELKHIVGHYISINGQNYHPESDRIFLVGDAAGFVDPLLGEGIYNGIVSGQLAAKAITEALQSNASAKEIYKKGLQIIKDDIAFCDKAAQWFYKNPVTGIIALTIRPASYLLMKTFAAGKTFSYLKKHPFKLLTQKIHPVQSLT